MNQIIYGNHLELYDAFNNIAPVACILFGFLFCNRLYENSLIGKMVQGRENNSKKHKLLGLGVTFVLYAISIALIFAIDAPLMPVLSKAFLKSYGDNYFAVLFATPVIVFVFSLLVRIPLLVYEDLLAVCSCASLVLFKIACYEAGCCYGIAYSGKFYNDYLDEYQLPIQLIELACAVVMFVILLVLFKKKKINGKLYPLFMLMYSGSRFISEFWRGDFPPVLGKMTGYHILCLIGFVLGAIFMIIAAAFDKKIDAFLERINTKSAERNLKFLSYAKANPNKNKLYDNTVVFIISLVVELGAYMLFVEVLFAKMRNVHTYNAILNAIGIDSVGIFLSIALSAIIGVLINVLANKDDMFYGDSNKRTSIIKYAIITAVTVVACGCIGSAIISAVGLVNVGIDLAVKVATMVIPFIWMYPLNKYFIHTEKKDYLG